VINVFGFLFRVWNLDLDSYQDVLIVIYQIVLLTLLEYFVPAKFEDFKKALASFSKVFFGGVMFHELLHNIDGFMTFEFENVNCYHVNFHHFLIFLENVLFTILADGFWKSIFFCLVTEFNSAN